jgi:exodeoxyribonuclease VII large subunit
MDRRDPPDWALPAWDEVAEATEPGTTRPRPPAPPGTFGLRILTVSEATRTIRGVVTADERLRDVWVEGEVGRVTISSAGHAYFSLKDERNQLQCVWFRDDRLASPFEARTGVHVVANGRIDLYEPTGALQLYVAALQPAGVGDLAIRLEELKARLAAEGLFDAGRKRPLPQRPATVAVVTSASGAAWHDVRTVLRRRWPVAEVLLVPCQVQGDGAAASVAAALDRLARYVGPVDPVAGPPTVVTIVARGGGSLEDLWSFNEEAVVRAIVRHPVPVVTGVGHEVDVTLADLAADVRAPTPSAAAEVVVPDRLEILGGIRAVGRRLDAAASRRTTAARAELSAEARALERLDPRSALAADRERVGHLIDRASRALLGRVAGDRSSLERTGLRLAPLLPASLAARRSALAAASAGLAALGPQATLSRGYAIVRRADDGRVVRDPGDVRPGAALDVRVAGGSFPARRATAREAGPS